MGIILRWTAMCGTAYARCEELLLRDIAVARDSFLLDCKGRLSIWRMHFLQGWLCVGLLLQGTASEWKC
jgi:hypothetical protein